MALMVYSTIGQPPHDLGYNIGTKQVTNYVGTGDGRTLVGYWNPGDAGYDSVYSYMQPAAKNRIAKLSKAASRFSVVPLIRYAPRVSAHQGQPIAAFSSQPDAADAVFGSANLTA